MYYKNKLFYCLVPEWQGLIANEIGAEFIDNKIIIIPKNLGYGHVFFIEVIPGISLILFDFVLSHPYEIFRIKNDVERYIIHFDLSDQANLLKVNTIEHQIGHAQNLGLTVLENSIESSFLPTINKRTFALRLFIDKKLMDQLIQDTAVQDAIRSKVSTGENCFFYSEEMDSNSIISVLSIKEKSVFDQSFDPFIKGIGLKLLGNFFNTISNPTDSKAGLSTLESEALDKVKNYLLENLENPFPSILFLSQLAGMSSSSFKLLFKKKFLATPNNFFIREKMIFAKTLLQSGKFNSLTDIIHELNYAKLDYFALKYYDVFHRKPAEDFVRKYT
jgi:AraC-like DNA-binding protein